MQMQPIEEEEEMLQMQPIEEEERLQMSSEKKPQTKSIGNNTNAMPSDRLNKMERAFGTSFSAVNFHINDKSSGDMGALAYTQGNDVHFAPGHFNPKTQKGQELIGHELAHVEQQRQGRVSATRQDMQGPVNDSIILEKEADIMGKKAANGEQVSHLSTINNYSLQKQEEPGENQAARDEFEREKDKELGKIGKTPSGREDETSGASPVQQKSAPIQMTGTRNISAGTTFGNIDKSSWRTYLIAYCSVNYTDSSIRFRMHVGAGVWYGIWVSTESIDFNATINIVPTAGSEIHANERAGSVFKDMDSPASGGLAVQTEGRNSNRQIALTPRFGAGCNGGGAVGAGVGPYSASVSFPDASLSQEVSLGTFIWELTTT